MRDLFYWIPTITELGKVNNHIDEEMRIPLKEGHRKYNSSNFWN
jgi:hypothetical protein